MRKVILLFSFILFTSLNSFGQDLTITSMTIEESYHRHSAFTYSMTIKNLGIVASNRAIVQVNFGEDELDFNNYAGYLNVPEIAADESITLIVDLSDYPYAIDKEIGTYYINANINPFNSNSYVDVDETNNTFSAGTTEVIASTADIILSSFNLSSSSNLLQGGLIQVNLYGENLGSPIQHSNVSLYLSQDQVFDETDGMLSGSSNNLRFNYSSQTTTVAEYEIPYQLETGDYAVFAVVDQHNRIDEINEDNNIYQLENITIGQSDAILSIDESTIYAYWHNSNELNLSFTVNNTGTSKISHFKYEIAGSFDGSIYSGYPLYIGEGDKIEAGGSSSQYEVLDRDLVEDSDYLIIQYNNLDGPTISPVSVYIGQPPSQNFNFNITNLYLESRVETLSSIIPLSIDLENPNDNPVYDYATIDIDFTSQDGQIVESYQVEDYISLYSYYDTQTLDLELPNRPSLRAGIYDVTVEITLNYEDGSASPFSSQIEILSSENTIDVDVVGQNGDIINEGTVYFYEKETDGSITYIKSQSLAEVNGTGNASFIRADGNYMFYIVPNKTAFPNYIRTVSGNTFKLTESSFMQVNNDTTVVIEPIYVAPNQMNGSKTIEGNLSAGMVTEGVSFKTNATPDSTIFSETPVYLIKDSEIVGVTYTTPLGQFAFYNVQEGDYEVYFDDGEILETNDMEAEVLLEETDDAAKLVINDSGQASVENLKLEIETLNVTSADIEAHHLELPINLEITNYYKSNNIDTLFTEFYALITSNNKQIDSINFSETISIAQNDTLRLNKSLDLSAELDTGNYEVEIYYFTQFQDSVKQAKANSFKVLPTTYDIEVIVKNQSGNPIVSGIVKMYNIEGVDTLYDIASLDSTGKVLFNSTSKNYILKVYPDTVLYPNALPTYHSGSIEYPYELNLTEDVTKQIRVAEITNKQFKGTKELVMDFSDTELDSASTLIMLLSAEDSIPLQYYTPTTQTLHLEDLEVGEYLMYFDDGNILKSHRSSMFTIDSINDLYVAKLYESYADSVRKFDYDIRFTTSYDDTVQYSGRTEQHISIAASVSKDSFDENNMLPVAFKIEFVNQSNGDTATFIFDEIINYNSFSEFSKSLTPEDLLSPGSYDITLSYRNKYTRGFTGHFTYQKTILDSHVILNNLGLLSLPNQEANNLKINLDIHGSSSHLTNIPIEYEYYILDESNDTVTSRNFIKRLDIDTHESLNLIDTIKLETPLPYGNYKLITNFYPVGKGYFTDQTKFLDFKIKDEELSLKHLSINKKPSSSFDSLFYSFTVYKPGRDSINNLDINLSYFILQDNDTIKSDWEDLRLNLAQFDSLAIDRKISFTGNLIAGDYTLRVLLKHPNSALNKIKDVQFRVINEEVIIKDFEFTNQPLAFDQKINTIFRVAANNEDSIANMNAQFKYYIINNSDTVQSATRETVLNIPRGKELSLTEEILLDEELQVGDYQLILKLKHPNKALNRKEEVLFRVKNEAVTLNNIEMSVEPTIISDSLFYNFKLSGNKDDAVSNLDVNLNFHLIQEGDTLQTNKESLNLDLEIGAEASYNKQFVLLDSLEPASYQLFIELEHPIQELNKSIVADFRVKDPTFSVSNLLVPDSISVEANSVNILLELTGNNNDPLDSLNTTFYFELIENDVKIKEELFERVLNIDKNSQINLSKTLELSSIDINKVYQLKVYYKNQFTTENSSAVYKSLSLYSSSEVITASKEISQNTYEVYPNPFNNEITIDGEFQKAFLYNSEGKVVRSIIKANSSFKSLIDLEAGIYMLVLEMNGETKFTKLIKQ